MKQVLFLIFMAYSSFIVKGSFNTDIKQYSPANFSNIVGQHNDFFVASFVRIQKAFLQVSPIKVVNVVNESSCLLNCAEINCISCNFATIPGSNGRHRCELLKNDIFRAVGQLSINNTYTHLTLKVSMTRYRNKEWGLLNKM